MQISKPVILVDGSSYFYRAYHALPPLLTSKGQPTGAIYGVVSMIKKLITLYHPDYLAVVFDSKAKTFRDTLYPAYKAHREMMPQDLIAQSVLLHELLRVMGMPVIIIDGVEADDVIGTLAKKISEQHNQFVLISSNDKDFAQLVNDRICLINTTGLINEQAVLKKFGVKPSQIIDYLTLVGDASDNIPGVSGVGPKTAAKWLNQYQTIDNFLMHRELVLKGKVRLAFEQFLPQRDLIKSLVTIQCALMLPAEQADLANLALKPADQPLLDQLLKKLEFKRWQSDSYVSRQNQPQDSARVPSQYKPHRNYTLIISKSAFEQLLHRLVTLGVFSMEIETTSLSSVVSAEIIGLSFGLGNREAYYLPLKHTAPKTEQLDTSFVFKNLKNILENKHIAKILHNIKYKINIFKNYQIALQGVCYDIMLQSYVLDSTASNSGHDIDSLALSYLHQKSMTQESILGKGSKQIAFSQVDPAVALTYAAEKADMIFQLYQHFLPKFTDCPAMQAYFFQIEMPLAFVLADMERDGVLIDGDVLTQQSCLLAQKIADLEKQAYQEAGEIFNLASPKQLQVIFYQKLKLPILEKTPSGQPSTAESVLNDLAVDYRLPRIILSHRALSKLKSTYTDKLPLQIDSKTGRVHTSYHQALTSTGRLSSSHPNLQNIPIRTQEGRLIRTAFIAPKGYQILSADYSQIELRLMAHLSQDPNLVAAFLANSDIHQATAAEIFNVPVAQVSKEQRRYAKTINFGLIYGMSAFGLARQLGISREQAKQYITTYFMRYPKVKHYMDQTVLSAREQGFVTTLQGRKLYLPNIQARNVFRQKAAERAAINAPLQGSAAELMKIAMINIQAFLRQNAPQARMIMQVHDELVFEVVETAIQPLQHQIKTLMENAMPLSVPLIASIAIGKNWEEAHA